MSAQSQLVAFPQKYRPAKPGFHAILTRTSLAPHLAPPPQKKPVQILQFYAVLAKKLLNNRLATPSGGLIHLIATKWFLQNL